MRHALLAFLFLMTTALSASAKETVVVLHGVALNRWYTARLARSLRSEGFEVLNVSYPSRTRTIAELGDRWLPELLEARGALRAEKLHFVTHSMGGLVVRRYLASQRPANLGRVVMLAPPNHGSAVADRLRGNWLVRLYLGKNFPLLGTGPGAAWRTLPQTADFELGILAGNRALNPCGRFWLEKPHDGTVAEASTRLEGMADHRVLGASHTGILFSREAARQTAAFLRDGRFAR